MGAATEDKETPRQVGEIVFQALGAAKKIFRGTLGNVDTGTGLAEAGTDAGSKKFCGVSVEACDNSAGLAGAKNCRFFQKGVFTFPYNNTVPTFDEKVYIYDDSTVGVVGETTIDICCGTVVSINQTAGTVDIDIARRV